MRIVTEKMLPFISTKLNSLLVDIITSKIHVHRGTRLLQLVQGSPVVQLLLPYFWGHGLSRKKRQQGHDMDQQAMAPTEQDTAVKATADSRLQ